MITSDLILINKYVAESIKQLIAGHLGHIGLRQLCKTEDAAVLYTVDKGMWTKHPAIISLFD